MKSFRRLKSRNFLLRLEQRLQRFGKNFRLPHETEVVRVRAVGAALAVVAVKMFAFDIIKIFVAGFFGARRTRLSTRHGLSSDTIPSGPG